MADENDLDILAWTMLGEAAGEGSQGMADVGHVVLNRLNTGKYGSSIADVAKSPKQFSTWNSGSGGNNPTSRYPKSSPEFKRARELASRVVAGTIPGPPGRPLDYNAPSVSPYWADSKAQHGTYERNGHVFYPSVPIPPGEIPNTVGTLTDTVEPAPTPVTPLPSTAAMRGMTSPSGGNGALQTALDQYATRERNRVTPQMPPVVSAQTIASFPSVPQGQDLTSPGGVNSYVGGMQQDPGLAAALAQRSAFNGDPLTPASGQVVASIPSMPAPRRSVPQSAIERAPNTGLAFNGDPMTPAAGPVVASIPSRPSVPTMSRAPVSYAGQERATAPVQTASAPVPSLPSPQLAGRRAVDPGLQAALDARYPAQLPQVAPPSQVPSSGVGLPPATRVAQSIPMQAPQAVPPRQQVGVSDMVRGFMPDMRERLPSTPMAGARATAPQALPGPFSVATLSNNVNEFGLPVTLPGSNPIQIAQANIAPTPFPPYRDVGSQLSIMPPMPRSRPMLTTAQRQAPMPMPMPNRPQVRAPFNILVQGSNTQRPQARQQMPQLTPQQAMIAAGNAAVNQSGDDSSGNRAEFAANMASAQSYRDAQARKR